MAPEGEWDGIIALAERACGGSSITSLISEAGKLVRAHWQEIIDIASMDEAVAA